MDGDILKKRRQREDRDKEESSTRDALQVNLKLDDLIQRADTLIERLNHLYQMFVTGVEKAAPIEQRKQLDQLIFTIQLAPKITQSGLFKANNVQARFYTYRDRWEKLLKDLEVGKIKRALGPKRLAI